MEPGRFRREARALAALNHPHIVTIPSCEQDGDTHFLTMELVSGKPLDTVIGGRGLPLDRLQEVAAAVADALAAAAGPSGARPRDVLQPGSYDCGGW